MDAVTETLQKGRLTMSEWIPVKERVPKRGQTVVVCNDDGQIGIARRNPNKLSYYQWQIAYCLYDYDIWDENDNGVIVAWMPRPKPYREED